MGIPWSQMILPKEEGGLGVIDLPIITMAANVNVQDLKILGLEWFNPLTMDAKEVYQEQSPRGHPPPNPTIDSIFWKSLMTDTAREDIDSCLECGANCWVAWNNFAPLGILGIIAEALRERSHKDPIAQGIWSHIPTKFSIIFWRIKWNHLKTFLRLRQWDL